MQQTTKLAKKTKRGIILYNRKLKDRHSVRKLREILQIAQRGLYSENL